MHMYPRKVRVWLVAVTMLFCVGDYLHAGYQFETLVPPSTENLIGGVSTVTDSQDISHVLFTRSSLTENVQELIYGYRDPSGWVLETVMTGTVAIGGQALALDSSGRPHIAGIDFVTKEVKYGVRTGSGWSVDTVAADGHFYTPAIQIGSDDSPQMAFMSSPSNGIGGPVHAVRSTAGVWVKTPSLIQNTLLNDSGDMDMVLDGGDRPFITYPGLAGFGQPWYVALASINDSFGGALTSDRVIEEPGTGPYVAGHLSMDNGGGLRVFAVESNTGPISHLVQSGNTWVEDFSRFDRRSFNGPGQMVVDDQGRSLLLTARNNNSVGIGAVDLWTLDSGVATQEIIAFGSFADGESVGLSHGMSLDSSGGLHIFYSQQLNRGLVYAYVPEPGVSTVLCAGLLLALSRRKT